MSQATLLPSSPVAPSFPPLAYQSVPVLTTEMLAQAYEVEPHQIRQNFKNNRERFVEGKHFFTVTNGELRDFRLQVESFYSQISPKVRSLTLWTERKQLTAIINTWVSMAPIHYASARAQVNAHFGEASVDALTVAQVREAIAWVQAKIDALPPVPERVALPAPEKDKFEAYLDEVEALRGHVHQELSRLLSAGIHLLSFKADLELIMPLYSIVSDWLRKAVLYPSPLRDPMGIDVGAVCILRELEKRLAQ